MPIAPHFITLHVGAAACPCPESLSTARPRQGQAARRSEDSQIPTPESPLGPVHADHPFPAMPTDSFLPALTAGAALISPSLPSLRGAKTDLMTDAPPERTELWPDTYPVHEANAPTEDSEEPPQAYGSEEPEQATEMGEPEQATNSGEPACSQINV